MRRRAGSGLLAGAGRWGRTGALLVAVGAGGARIAGQPAVLAPVQPQETSPAPAPAGAPGKVQPVRTPPVRNPKLIEDLAKLRGLIEAAESALEEKDWDGAADAAGQAEDLVADWPDETMKLPEAAALRARLTDLEQHLPDTEEVPDQPDPGLKEAVEVVPLSPDEQRSELAQVRGAEMGAAFDFPIDLNDKVLAWVHQFTTSKRVFMERALSRASQYLPMVRQIFSEEGVPQDLAYLAVIESGFVNSASSYAKAVGMWQFMRSTGRIYGLGGNAWVEERRDPVKATRAAARYLKRLYESSGDWYLALASYNAGPLTTERAIDNLGTRNFWDMYRSRWLRNQTKNYVPEMCAAVLVGRFPERYGLSIEQMPPYTYETVQVDHMTSLPVLARYAGTDVNALKELNPELLRATTPPGSYTLRVPPGQSAATARALAQIPASQRLDFKAYRLRRGDTLVRVARRFNLSPADLLAANNLTAARFRPGRVIQVPPPPVEPIDTRDLRSPAEQAADITDRPLENLPPIPAESAATAAEPSEGEIDPPAPKPAARPEAPVRPAAAIRSAAHRPVKPAMPAVHVVKRGETLFAIAERYGLEVQDLKRWNRIRSTALVAGQRLRLQP